MNIVILGPQGSGKGTQAEMLAKKFNLDHFDTGRSLRQVALLNTPLGKEVHEIVMVKKELVPSRILKEILHIRLNDLPREQGMVFDGVPRNIEQSNYFEEALFDFGRKIDQVIFINLSEKESIKRISNRWICKKCKKVLIMGKDVKSEKEKCPECGAEIFQREDDTETGVRKRLEVFKEETLPVIEYFREKGMVTEIDGDKEIEKVFASLLMELGELK